VGYRASLPGARATLSLSRRMAGEETDGYEAELTVDGRQLPLAPFVRQIIASTVFGLVGALKGGENAREVRLTLRRSDPAAK